MLRFYRVSKVFNGQYPAVADVDFTLEKGEFAFLTGPSGSGKSTILKMAAGLSRPTSGQVLVFGRNVATQTDRQLRQMRTRIGVVFQDFKLLYDRTVFDNIEFALDVTGQSTRNRKQRIESVLEWVGLLGKARSMPHRLSGGEQQRVAIARAVCLDPALLLADEPTGNLDDEMSMQILDLFTDLHHRGTTILMASHSREIIERTPRKTIMLRSGRVEATRY